MRLFQRLALDKNQRAINSATVTARSIELTINNSAIDLSIDATGALKSCIDCYYAPILFAPKWIKKLALIKSSALTA